MKKNSKILLSIPVLALSASMVLASCDNHEEKKDDDTSLVSKEVQEAIDAKVKELEKLKEDNKDGEFTPESVEKYNKEIDGFIEEVKKLKTLDEVKNFEYEISSQLQEAEKVTKIGDLKTTTEDAVTVKGVVVASDGGDNAMIDDGTGRVNLFLKDSTPVKEGDYIKVSGKLGSHNSYLCFQVNQDNVQIDQLDKNNAPKINKEVKDIEQQGIYDIAKKIDSTKLAPATYEYHPLVKVKASLSIGKYKNYNVTAKGDDGKTITIGGGFFNCMKDFDAKANNNKDFLLTGYMFSGMSHPGLMVIDAKEVLKDVEYTLDKNSLNLDKENDTAKLTLTKFNNGAELVDVKATEGIKLDKAGDKNEWNITAAKECRGTITINYKIGDKSNSKSIKFGATHEDNSKLETIKVAECNKDFKLLINQRFKITGIVSTETREIEDKKTGEKKTVTDYFLTEGEDKVKIFQIGGEKAEWNFNAGEAYLKQTNFVKDEFKTGDMVTMIATYNTKYKSLTGTYNVDKTAEQIKEEADKKALDEAKAAKTEEINKLALTDEEKAGKTKDSITKAEAKLTELKTAAIAEVEKAETVEAVEAVQVPSKDEAIKLLEDEKEPEEGTDDTEEKPSTEESTTEDGEDAE